MLIGSLSKEYGYTGYEPIRVGTLVYEENDRYHFYARIGVEKRKIKFYKEDLAKHIIMIK